MQAVSDKMVALLEQLSALECLEGYYLAGGTNLAYRFNHRTSIDLDFFTESEFDITKNNLLLQELKHVFGTLENTKVSRVGLFTFIDGIKLDFVIYPFPMVKEIEVRKEIIRLASIEDIAAMKMNAIIGRGSRKDFFDLHYLLNHLSLDEMFEAYTAKYGVDNITQLFMSLTYFEDGNDNLHRNNIYEPVEHQVSWPTIKKDISKAVETYISKITK